MNLRVNPPRSLKSARLPEGSMHLSFLSPLLARRRARAERARITILSFDLFPRISRAQYMDALSSQATVSGYRAALAGATYFDRFFPLADHGRRHDSPGARCWSWAWASRVSRRSPRPSDSAPRCARTTCARPPRRRPNRPARSSCKLGVTADAAGGYARELTDEERLAQQAALLSEVANADVVITTAAVPGRKSPILLTTAMVEAMGEGSVVIDMAADGGGNCELTVAGEVVDHGGVRVVGHGEPARADGRARRASCTPNNVLKLLALFGAKGELEPGLERRGRHRRDRGP